MGTELDAVVRCLLHDAGHHLQHARSEPAPVQQCRPERLPQSPHGRSAGLPTRERFPVRAERLQRSFVELSEGKGCGRTGGTCRPQPMRLSLSPRRPSPAANPHCEAEGERPQVNGQEALGISAVPRVAALAASGRRIGAERGARSPVSAYLPCAAATAASPSAGPCTARSRRRGSHRTPPRRTCSRQCDVHGKHETYWVPLG